MKKIILFSGVAALLLASTGCSDERDIVASEGSVIFSTSFSNDVKVASRATLEEELSESCLLWISSEKGLVRQYKGLANVPAEGIKLVGGNYVAEAWAGDSVSASFDKKYYKGRAPFTITSGTQRVELKCNIANVVASVRYAAGVDEVLSDYSLTIGHRRGSLTFEGRDERKGYFMMPTGVNTLTWKLTGTQVDGTVFTKEGEIADPKGATEYILNVLYTGSEDELGAGYLTIEIDDKTVDIEDNIVITSAPEIKGVGYDITKPVFGEEHNVGKKSVYISAATSLKSVVVKSTNLVSVISGDDVDLMNAQPAVIQSLNDAGIDFIYTHDEAEDISNLKLNFNEEFTDLLTGENSFEIVATDDNGKSAAVTLVISITDATVEADALSADAPTTWATKAVITGSIMKADAADPGFEYRVSGSGEWTHVEGVVSGSVYSAELTGLVPGTTYEYRATATDFVSTTVRTFTTESAAQLPNASFEEWDTSDKCYQIHAPGGVKFWDSGNQGATTLGNSITTPSTDYAHDGQYSARLESKFVGIGIAGKFAAGNMFAGEYLATDVTDGILGWGRRFTSRPKAVRLYVKYTPATVSNSSTSAIAKGDMDMGIIYCAILDGSLKNANSSKVDSSKANWPVIVKTKSSERQLFNRDDENVIAYGEHIFTEDTGDMIEVEIPLEYMTEDVKAANIVLTCSASRYGDYFSGGPSVMYVDDIRLIY